MGDLLAKSLISLAVFSFFTFVNVNEHTVNANGLRISPSITSDSKKTEARPMLNGSMETGFRERKPPTVLDTTKVSSKNKRQEVIDMARLSNNTYDVGAEKYKAPPGYTLEDYRFGKDGFQAATYKNTTTGQIVVAYRGTDEFKDVQVDTQLVLDENGPQYNSQIKQALDYYDYVKQNSGYSNITVTGHSLGGNLAQIVGAKNEVFTHTFNAPGVSESTVEKYVGPINKSLPIVNHVRNGDVVGNYGDHIGEVMLYPEIQDNRSMQEKVMNPLSAPGTLDAHSMDLMTKDLESRKDFEGVKTTDAKLQEERARKAIEEKPLQKILENYNEAKEEKNKCDSDDKLTEADDETHEEGQDAESDGKLAEGEGQGKEPENKADSNNKLTEADAGGNKNNKDSEDILSGVDGELDKMCDGFNQEGSTKHKQNYENKLLKMVSTANNNFNATMQDLKSKAQQESNRDMQKALNNFTSMASNLSNNDIEAENRRRQENAAEYQINMQKTQARRYQIGWEIREGLPTRRSRQNSWNRMPLGGPSQDNSQNYQGSVSGGSKRNECVPVY